jgi:hypothetical protein
MPAIVNEDETDAQYMCDVCGVEIQNQTEGAYCPAYGRVFCFQLLPSITMSKLKLLMSVMHVLTFKVNVTLTFSPALIVW